MRKILRWVVVFAILTVLLWCEAAIAETGGTDGNITWSLSDEGVLTISGSGAMKKYDKLYVNDI